MGWTSTYTPYAPTTAERKQELINELTFSNNKVESVALKATMRGSTGYALQKVIDKETGDETVYSVAMLTNYGEEQFAIKFVDPILFYNDFPITWIEEVTIRSSEHAENLIQWRENIKNTTKKKKLLKSLKPGTIINTKYYGDLTLKIGINGKRYWMSYDENGHCEGYVPTRRFGTNFTIVKKA